MTNQHTQTENRCRRRWRERERPSYSCAEGKMACFLVLSCGGGCECGRDYSKVQSAVCHHWPWGWRGGGGVAAAVSDIPWQCHSLKCCRRNMCAGGGSWWRWLVIYPDNCTYLSVIGRISVQGEGAWRRLAMHPDNFTYLSAIGRISVRGEGAWRLQLQTRTRVQAHQWAANYFIVRMVVPGTKPVENPWFTSLFLLDLSDLIHTRRNTRITWLMTRNRVYWHRNVCLCYVHLK